MEQYELTVVRFIIPVMVEDAIHRESDLPLSVYAGICHNMILPISIMIFSDFNIFAQRLV